MVPTSKTNIMLKIVRSSTTDFDLEGTSKESFSSDRRFHKEQSLEGPSRSKSRVESRTIFSIKFVFEVGTIFNA